MSLLRASTWTSGAWQLGCLLLTFCWLTILTAFIVVLIVFNVVIGLNYTTPPDHIPLNEAMCINADNGQTRTPRQRALLIACSYKNVPCNLRLPYTSKDPVRIKTLLTGNYGWENNEITVLDEELDDPEAQPTKDNIIKHMKLLVEDARSGDLLFFHLSGHGFQKTPEVDPYEMDKLDEYFVTCDAREFDDARIPDRYILDDQFREILISHLPAGCRFLGLIDCCNSGTMLDMQEPQSPMSAASEPGDGIPTIDKILTKRGASSKRRDSVILSLSPHRIERSPSSLTTGPHDYLPDPRVIQGDVISIASCADGRSGFETEEGGTLVLAFCTILQKSKIGDQGITTRVLNQQLLEHLSEQHKKAKSSYGESWDNNWLAPEPKFTFSPSWSWGKRYTLCLQDINNA